MHEGWPIQVPEDTLFPCINTQVTCVSESQPSSSYLSPGLRSFLHTEHTDKPTGIHTGKTEKAFPVTESDLPLYRV